MSPAESVHYLLSLQPSGIKLGLENMRRLCAALDHPERSLACVHIAGTNGKGSVAAMLDSILRCAGLRSGLYTSPHLIDFGERIRVEGRPMAPEVLAARVGELRVVLQRLAGEGCKPTFFEATTALAFQAFREAGTGVVVLETGLGGRLDSTNVVDPVACAITRIGMDHQEYLGSTLEAIAKEKAGILKPGRPAVLGEMPGEAMRVVEARARELDVTLVHAGNGKPTGWNRREGLQAFTFDGRSWATRLPGAHQAENAAVVLAMVGILRGLGWTIPDAAITAGLLAVDWPARFEIVRHDPPLVIDGGHNEDGIRAALAFWQECFGEVPGRIVFASMRDKDLDAMVGLLDRPGYSIDLVPVDSPRCAPPHELAARFHQAATRCWDRLAACHAQVRTDPDPAGTLVLGSLYLAGEWKSLDTARPHQLGLNA